MEEREGGGRDGAGPSLRFPPEEGVWLERKAGSAGHSPSGIVEVNKEPILPEFGEHLIMVTVHVSCEERERGW